MVPFYPRYHKNIWIIKTIGNNCKILQVWFKFKQHGNHKDLYKQLYANIKIFGPHRHYIFYKDGTNELAEINGLWSKGSAEPIDNN